MLNKQKIVVLRFSAMGDVAMVAAVLREFCAQNPNTEVIMVSRPAFEPFFNEIPNVTFHSIYPKTTHQGILGLFKLFKSLKKLKPTAIADLHENLRSRIICSFFRFTRVKIARINKGRAEKKALTRLQNKILKPLKPTVNRYADVFTALGFKCRLSHQLIKTPQPITSKISYLFTNTITKKVGISPFAQHSYKVYPLEKMEEVVKTLSEKGYELFIFGGGKNEAEIGESWQTKYKNVSNLIGKHGLNEELAIISNIDLMLSMDSAGMHMASLVGIPVVSIWGPTHPYAGFLGYGQIESDCLQIAHPSRPNSIYGNKPCLCGDVPCIALLKPEIIVEKIISKLKHG